MSSVKHPVELIRVQRQTTPLCQVAVAEMQGLRPTHEDAHFILPTDANACAHFGVLDGHGGSSSARLAAKHLPSALEIALTPQPTGDDIELSDKIKQAFVDTDKWLWHEMSKGTRPSGSTCVTCSVQGQGDKYVCHLANAGDSRGLCIQHSPRVTNETVRHRPDLEVEASRITAAGGKVENINMCSRLDGILAVSRGFADFRFKDMNVKADRQKLSCVPDIYRYILDEGDIVILGCDGIFDFMSPSTLVYKLEQTLDRNRKIDLGAFCIEVLERCLELQRLSKSGQGDNMTLMAIRFGASDGSISEATNEIYGLEKLERILPRQRKLWHAFLEYSGEYGPLQPEAAQDAYISACQKNQQDRAQKLQEYGLGELRRLPASDKTEVAHLLKKILNDLAANPQLDSRVRRINLTTTRMQKALGTSPGVEHILQAVGYVREGEELVLPSSIPPEDASKAAQKMHQRVDAAVPSAAAYPSTAIA